MASGNYTRKISPQEPMEITSRVPARATRQLPDILIVEDEGKSTTTTFSFGLVKKPKVYATASGALSVSTGVVVEEYTPHPLKRHQPWLVPVIAISMISVLFLVIILSAGMFQRPQGLQLLSARGGQVYDVQVGGALASTWQKDQPLAPKTPLPKSTGPYSVLGAPSMNVDAINRVLAAYNSPAAGKGQALYDMGKQYGIDPAFALAFFMHESSFGTKGEARTSLSLGNLRCIPNVECRDGYAWFPSWEAGFKAWYELIRNLYVAQWGRTTIEQIIPKYAPSSDNNDEAAYIASLKHELDTWHAGGTIVS